MTQFVDNQWVFKTISRSTNPLTIRSTKYRSIQNCMYLSSNKQFKMESNGIAIYNSIKNMNNEKYKTLLRESKDNLNKRRAVLHSWIRKLDIVRMLIICNLIYGLNAVLHQNPSRLFVLDHLTFKFTWKCIQLSSQNNSEKNKVENLHKYKTDCDNGLWIMTRLEGQK